MTIRDLSKAVYDLYGKYDGAPPDIDDAVRQAIEVMQEEVYKNANPSNSKDEYQLGQIDEI